MGWVKCSERLPEEDGEYRAILEIDFVGKQQWFCIPFIDGKWFPYRDAVVIGWYEQEPLPDWARENDNANR